MNNKEWCICTSSPDICPVHTKWVNTNPKEKQAEKDSKVPLEYLVYSVLKNDALCHKHGADKYGKLNWRITGIKKSTYIAAIMRHLLAYESGEEIDSDSGLPHLTHIRACCAVILDSQLHSEVIDDTKPTLINK